MPIRSSCGRVEGQGAYRGRAEEELPCLAAQHLVAVQTDVGEKVIVEVPDTGIIASRCHSPPPGEQSPDERDRLWDGGRHHAAFARRRNRWLSGLS